MVNAQLISVRHMRNGTNINAL